jgi:hypothetical protein
LNLFKKKTNKKIYSPVVPSGLIAKTEKGFYYIKGNKKFKFVSEKAMTTWSLPIIETKDPMLSQFITAGVLGFRDGTLIKDVSDGRIYLVSDSKLRHVVEPEVFEWLDVKVIEAGQKEVSVHEKGEILNGS